MRDLYDAKPQFASKIPVKRFLAARVHINLDTRPLKPAR